MSRSSHWRLTGAAAAAMIGLMAIPAGHSSANTQYIHLMGSRLGINQGSVPNVGGNLQYHGGPVMKTSTTYTIFWQPSGTYMSPGYQTLINRYFSDVGGSTLYNNNTQYSGIVNSSTLGGSWTDTSPYPSGSISDAQIQGEVVKAMSTNGWTGGTTHAFFVFISRGENTCMSAGSCFIGGGGFCAYHGYFSSGGTTVIYSNMPYANTVSGCSPGGTMPNSNPDADAEINVTSHEHMESVTDPTLSAWFDRAGQEIGDKCAWIFGTRSSDGGNITMNGHRYIVQKEWDNHTRGCTLAGP